MYTIAVCENNPIDAEKLRKCIEFYFINHPALHTIEHYTSGESFVYHMKSKSYHVVFFAVMLGKMNGIEAARRLRMIDKSVVIIFYSKSADHVWHCFDVEPLHYLRKPIVYEKVHNVLERAMEKLQNESPEVFTFSSNNATFRVPLKEIVYFESKLRVITLRTIYDHYRFYGKLDDVEKALQNSSFVRCHQSYVVNMRHIQQITNYSYLTTTNETVVISRKKAQEMKNRFHDHSGNGL